MEEEVRRVWLRGVDTVERGQGVLGQQHLGPGHPGPGVAQCHGPEVVLRVPHGHVGHPHSPGIGGTQLPTLEVETFGTTPEVIIIESVILVPWESCPPAGPRAPILAWSRTHGPLAILSRPTQIIFAARLSDTRRQY